MSRLEHETPMLRFFSCLITQIVLMLLSVVFAGLAGAASFDCRKASTPDETAICVNSGLSSLDESVAAAFAAARVREPATTRPLSLLLLRERRGCGADIVCLQTVMTKALAAYNSIVSGARSEVGASAGDKMQYGSRAGMQVTVLSRSGIDTANAVIRVEHRRDDAIAYCRDYVQNVTEACIEEELSGGLRDNFFADCTTGRFTTINGQNYVFMGKNLSSEQGVDNQYFVVESGTSESLDGTMASNYPIAVDQFKALCPSRVQ